MGRLVYTAIGSLDGYLADATGDFSWAAPDAQVHAFVNAQERGVGTYLYGRRTYELMTVWETDPAFAAEAPETAEFAQLWQAADKVVYSATLTDVPTTRTTLRRAFDADEVADWKAASELDLAIAGPTLAQHAFTAGLVDELQVYLVPVVVAGGLPYWPSVRTSLRLTEERRFDGGVVWLRYATTS